MTLTTATPAMPPAELPAGLILFGLDDRKRPHASCFFDEDLAPAERAAELMGLRTLPLHEDAHRELAALLPKGRIFPASGKAFVPFVKAELFERLTKAATSLGTAMPLAAATKPAGGSPTGSGGQPSGAGPRGTDGPHKPPIDWDEIGIGSLVLATTGPMEGWFEACVRLTQANDHFVLQWRDWPLEPEISRHRSELALLHPGTRAAGA